MASQYAALDSKHIAFIQRQHLFFVATAAADGRVNLSPKGLDAFRVLDSNRIIWLNLTGSGNETAAHLLQNDRMTIMFCSFDKQPLILRLYGRAQAVHINDDAWEGLYAQFPADPGARQIFDMQVDLVQTSCGFAVPFYTFAGERDTLTRHAEKQGEAGKLAYWRDSNATSLDGFPTGIPVLDV